MGDCSMDNKRTLYVLVAVAAVILLLAIGYGRWWG
jgi:hypothetical protein